MEVEVGTSLSGRSGKQKQFLQFVARGTRRNQLFLTQAIGNNVVALSPIFEWFREICLILSAEATSRDFEAMAHTDSAFVSFLSRFLCTADTGIESVTTGEVPFEFERYAPDMPEEQREKLRESVARLPSNALTMIRSEDGERYVLRRGNQGEPILVRFNMQHMGKDGQRVPFHFHEESEGTQRLINLLPALFSLHMADEGVVIVDELDRRLHPMVSRFRR